MKINIQEFRKAAGMTQEQLGKAVGVSGAAVSKWEAGNTFPDITLLIPLARALGCTLDGLMSFQNELSRTEAEEIVNDLKEIYRQEGFEKGFQKSEAVIHEYPDTIYLKLLISSLYFMAPTMSLPTYDWTEDKAQKLKVRSMELLEAVAAGAEKDLAMQAAFMLGMHYLQQKEFEKARTYMEMLPEGEFSRSDLYVDYYAAQEDYEKAELFAQRSLLQAAQKAVNAVSRLANFARQTKKPEKALAYLETGMRIYSEVDPGGILNYEQKIRILIELGRYKEAAETMTEFVDKVISLDYDYSENPMLFRLTAKPEVHMQKNMCQLLLKGFEEEQFDPIRGEEMFQESMRRLEGELDSRKVPFF